MIDGISAQPQSPQLTIGLAERPVFDDMGFVHSDQRQSILKSGVHEYVSEVSTRCNFRAGQDMRVFAVFDLIAELLGISASVQHTSSAAFDLIYPVCLVIFQGKQRHYQQTYAATSVEERDTLENQALSETGFRDEDHIFLCQQMLNAFDLILVWLEPDSFADCLGDH